MEISVTAGQKGENLLTGHKDQSGRCRKRLSYTQRLHHPKDFQKVYATRDKVHASNAILCYRRNELKTSRLGVSVGVKHGNAVCRNRIKRVFRAAFRHCRHLLPQGYDYVLIPRQGSGAYNTLDMCVSLGKAAAQLKIKLR